MIAPIESLPVYEPAQPEIASRSIGELLETVSASRLNCWHQCRLKFFFRYVEQIRKAPTPSLHIGVVVHAVLQAWSMARWKKESFIVERFRTLFDSKWADQQGRINWGDNEPAQKKGAWSLLEVYFTETPIKANEMPEAVEVPVEAELSSHGLPTLIGVLDLVRSGGRIVDFKTAGRTPSAEDAIHQHEAQLSCYSILYREAAGKEEAGLELHHLVKTKAPKVVISQFGPMNQRQETRLFRLMESYVDGLQRQDFVPSPGMQCVSCEYFQECRRWC